MGRGIFITIEGGDGSGKSTLVAKIEAWLVAQGRAVLKTREPGGTPVAEEIREVLLKPRTQRLSPRAELLLYQAARADHVDHTIEPALAENRVVLCDRFTDSTIAYQGDGRGFSKSWIKKLNTFATESRKPTLTIWLKITPKQAAERMAKRESQTLTVKDRMEQEASAFHSRVFKGFQKLAKAEPRRFIVLDATKAPDEVFAQLLASPSWRRVFKTRGVR